ncbi:MAG: hypothetical protein ACOYM7_07265 [Paludibacter sp.]
MKKFLFNLLIFVIAFLIFDKIFYVFIYIAPNRKTDTRLEQVIKGKINKDCIVIGSSRGARNIIANQLEKGIGQTCYNLSYLGSDIEFHEFLLRSLIKFNQKPKTVLLAIDDPFEFSPSESNKFRLEVLYPLVKYNYINDELIARGEKNYLSKILCLSRVNKANFVFRKKQFTVLDSITECGSMPISFPRENRIYNYDSSNQIYLIENELKNKINAFMKFQDLCHSNGIKLYLIFSPNFKQYNFIFENRIRQLTNKDVGYFIYDLSNAKYKDKAYFFDEGHLQANGAILFTDEIIKFLNIEKLPNGNKNYMQ